MDNNVLILNISYVRRLVVEVGPIVIGIVALVFILYLLYRRFLRKEKSSWSAVEAEISLGGLGKVKLKPSYDDIQVAHKAWVELATRKAGLPFEEEHDVIVEVYNSWYELFREMRNLAKQIPAEKVRESTNTRNLVRLLIDALTLGLRPHLTRWQAKFRRWYDEASTRDENRAKTPQEIQREYPEYGELVADLKSVSKDLVEYTMFVKRVAQGEERKD